MEIMIVIIGVTLCGIGVAVWLMLSSEKEPEQFLNKQAQPSQQIDTTEVAKKKPTEDSPSDVKAGKNFFSKLSFMKNKSADKKPDSNPNKEKSSAKADASNPLKKILDKAKNLSNLSSDRPDDRPPLPSLKDFLEAERKKSGGGPNQDSGTAAIQVNHDASAAAKPPDSISKNGPFATNPPGMISKEEEKHIEQHLELSTELNTLKEKYNRVNELLIEKNKELEKTKDELSNELKNRKDFNKVKDILEKELKDSKDKAKSIQAECDTAKIEMEGHKNRLAQFEGKNKILEKSLIEKNDKIDELIKRLQTFASASTASEPIKPAAAISEITSKMDQPPPPSLKTNVEGGGDKEEGKITPQNEMPEIAMNNPETTHPNDPRSLSAQDAPTEKPSDPKTENFLKLQPDIFHSEEKKPTEAPKTAPAEKKIIKIITPEENKPSSNQ